MDGLSPARPRCLVALVGEHPASVVIAASALRPERVLLVHTAHTARQAGVVAGQLAAWTACVSISPQPPLADGVRSIADALAAACAPGERVAVDITGGTKPMSLAAIAAARHGRPEPATVYLAPSGVLVDVDDGVPVADEPAVHPADVLAWYGVSVRDARWGGHPSEAPPELRARARVGSALARAWPQLGREAGGGAFRLSPADVAALISDLPAGFRLRHDGFIEPHDPSWIDKGVWLEELCLAWAADVLGHVRGVRAALGVAVERGGGANDEIDVVLTHGARVVVVEAKARSKAAGAGAELQKRVFKAREFLGNATRVVFVHPAWGNEPPDDLARVVGDSATLVGSSVATYTEAIRAGLGA